MKRNGATRTFLCSQSEQSGHVLDNQSAGKLAQKQAKKNLYRFFFACFIPQTIAQWHHRGYKLIAS
jgi:hypothetical protein